MRVNRLFTQTISTISSTGNLQNVILNYNHDGTRIVSGACGPIEIWNAAKEGTAIITLKSNTTQSSCVFSVMYNHDGTRVVSGADDKSIRIWDAVNGGEPIFTIPLDGVVRSVRFNKDSSRIVFSLASSVQIWNTAQGSSIMNLTGHNKSVTAVQYSPDGTLVASGSHDKTIKIWDAINKGPAKLTLTGHTGVVSSIAFSPNGKRIASASRDHTINIWDPIAGGKPLLTLTGHANEVWSIAYSPDGEKLLSTSEDNTIRMWVLNTGEKKVILDDVRAADLDFSPDGKRIAFSSDKKFPNFQVWEVLDSEQSLLPSTSPSSLPSTSPSSLSSTPPSSHPTNKPIMKIVQNRRVFALSGHGSMVRFQNITYIFLRHVLV